MYRCVVDSLLDPAEPSYFLRKYGGYVPRVLEVFYMI
jgi:hypothetical protein